MKKIFILPLLLLVIIILGITYISLQSKTKEKCQEIGALMGENEFYKKRQKKYSDVMFPSECMSYSTEYYASFQKSYEDKLKNTPISEHFIEYEKALLRNENNIANEHLKFILQDEHSKDKMQEIERRVNLTKQQQEKESEIFRNKLAEGERKSLMATYGEQAIKLHKKHPEWSLEDCSKISKREIWIGMTYDMLVVSYGQKPDHSNPSNYGGVTQWQWCWDSFTPKCFYDNNNDGKIDSYN